MSKLRHRLLDERSSCCANAAPLDVPGVIRQPSVQPDCQGSSSSRILKSPGVEFVIVQEDAVLKPTSGRVRRT